MEIDVNLSVAESRSLDLRNKKEAFIAINGVPRGNRTPVGRSKTYSPRPLDDGDRLAANRNVAYQIILSQAGMSCESPVTIWIFCYLCNQ